MRGPRYFPVFDPLYETDSDELEDAGSGHKDAQDVMEEDDEMPLPGTQQVEGSSARSTSASHNPRATDPAEELEHDRDDSSTEGKIDFMAIEQPMPDVGRLEISVTASLFIDFNDLASLSTLQLVGSIANPAFTADQVGKLRTELTARIKHGQLSIQPDGWDYCNLPASCATSYWGSKIGKDEEMAINSVKGEGAKTPNKGDKEVVQCREEVAKERAKVQKGKRKAANEPGNAFLEAFYTDKELHNLMRDGAGKKRIPERLKMPSPSDLNKMDPSTTLSEFPGVSDITTARIQSAVQRLLTISNNSAGKHDCTSIDKGNIGEANRLILFLSQYLVKFDPLACAGNNGKHFVMLDLDRLRRLGCLEDKVDKLNELAAPSTYTTPNAGEVKKGIVMSIVKCRKALAFKRLHLLVPTSALLSELEAEVLKDEGFKKVINKAKKDLVNALISACTTRAALDSVTVEARTSDKSFIEWRQKDGRTLRGGGAPLNDGAQRLSPIFCKLIIEPAVKTARSRIPPDAPKKTRASDALSSSPRPLTGVPVRDVIIGTTNRAEIASSAPAAARFIIQYCKLERECLLNPSPRFVLVDRDGALVLQPKLNWSIYKEARAMSAKHLVPKFEELIKKAGASSALFYIPRKSRTGTHPPSGKQMHKPFHKTGAGSIQTELYTVYFNPTAKASKNPINALPKKATAMDPQSSSNKTFNVIKGIEECIKKAEDKMNKIDGKHVKELLNALDNVLGWSAGQAATLAQRPNIRLVMNHVVVIRHMLSVLVDNETTKREDAQTVYSTCKLLLAASGPSSFKNLVARFLGLEGIFDAAMEGVQMTQEWQMSLAQIVLYTRPDVSVMLFVSDQQTVIGKFGSLDDAQTEFHTTMPQAQPACNLVGRRGFSLEVLNAKSMGIPVDIITCATGPCPWNYTYSTSLAYVWVVLCRYGMFVKAEEALEDEEGEFVKTEESGNENDKNEDAKFNDEEEVED
ncbi:hypothetical protein Rhopal_005906-T1 [Rhodotorula paludigena]|uniref:Uncharacterized protein n=1 Tax=Rhodotorula paludigena TaxID=86838 RepID=A0AAV5GJQ5_9BASI|nr:hypothetical protein Rhopal_005906-T1 [Rhodotorula paludigena]